ncbi:tRNA pseudouridine(55) synthase TruB [Gulosibacter molinativorax]|uniref:tRNA pseudouridine synthase B n=1 Tax=Gulosibacter molinativorax TaxID=256821 RepID=A0ABT7C3L4_9MICO|nr:tRNA pseudouridine(55) synthase TruB [Gulosibacter molinativorax]MDJ1369847.1 tRNA pseudouridine(55) synthase TruB [Gulosibacter molinativorax]QUY61812.1 tRNA pseudouridine synthase B [Gulosibacter molinativorax]
MSSRPLAPHGLLPLDKPGGITSHDLVARTRKALGTRKVGHAGTLDPMATGLMLLGVGDATRLLTFFVGADKTYEATVRFGIATSTEDADGEVTEVSDIDAIAAITSERILEAAAQLTGDIEQVPSAVSAIKVNGRRAHERVRAGEDVQLKARPVSIYAIELLGIEQVDADLDSVERAAVVDARIRVDCSSGTYVRALARDLGAKLGVGAHLTALRRTRIGDLTLADARHLPSREEIDAGSPPPKLIRPAEAIRKRFEVVQVDEAQAKALRFGQRIPAPEGFAQYEGPLAVADADGELIGLVEILAGKTKAIMNMPERAAATRPSEAEQTPDTAGKGGADAK